MGRGKCLGGFSGIIEAEENGTQYVPLTSKQVGRILTEIGLTQATSMMNDTVIESTKSEEKNV